MKSIMYMHMYIEIVFNKYMYMYLSLLYGWFN